MRFSKLMALAAMVLAVPLAACGAGTSQVATPSSTAPPTTTETAQAIGDQVVFRAAQGFTLAVVSYRATVAIVDFGVDVGLIRGPLAATIQGYNREAMAAIEKGNKAIAKADKATEAIAAAEALAAIAKITALPVIKQVQQLMGQRTQHLEQGHGTESG